MLNQFKRWLEEKSKSSEASIHDAQLFRYATLAVSEFEKTSGSEYDTIVVACNESGETAIYFNGELQDREDSNDAYEIARITESLPCRVITISPTSCRSWPKLLSEIPLLPALPRETNEATSVVWWKGKPLEDYTKDELIGIVKDLGKRLTALLFR